MHGSSYILAVYMFEVGIMMGATSYIASMYVARYVA